MKKLAFIASLFLSTNAFSAVTFSSSATSGYVTSDDSYSFNHTVFAGSDRYLLVGVLISANQSVLSVTYNGDSLSLLETNGSVIKSEIWGLASPDVGADQAVVVTLDAVTDSTSIAASFAGVGSTEAGDGSSGIVVSNTFSTTATTLTNNAVVVDFALVSDESITVGAGQTERANFNNGSISFVASTEGPKTPAGSVAMSWGNGDDFDIYAQSVIALAPIVGQGSIFRQGVYGSGVTFR